MTYIVTLCVDQPSSGELLIDRIRAWVPDKDFVVTECAGPYAVQLEMEPEAAGALSARLDGLCMVDSLL